MEDVQPQAQQHEPQTQGAQQQQPFQFSVSLDDDDIITDSSTNTSSDMDLAQLTIPTTSQPSLSSEDASHATHVPSGSFTVWSKEITGQERCLYSRPCI
jgi:hypothetical protein